MRQQRESRELRGEEAETERERESRAEQSRGAEERAPHFWGAVDALGFVGSFCCGSVRMFFSF
jgi:hypothetical protein